MDRALAADRNDGRTQNLPMKRLALSALVAMGLLQGCASYRPHDLGTATDVLGPPDITELLRSAAALERPYLRSATIDLSAPLDINAVATIAVIANPDLKSQRLRAGVLEAQSFDAGLLPDPTFNIGASKVLAGPDPYLDIARALSLDINALRTRSVRIRIAKAQERQVRLDLAWSEWQTSGMARILVAKIESLRSILELAHVSGDVAQSLLDRSLRAAARGDLPADRAQAARTAAYDAADRFRTTERDLAAAKFELTKLLGLPPATLLELAPVPIPGPPPVAARLFDIARLERADLQALQSGYAAQEAIVHKAVLDQFPTLALTINANRDSAGNKLVGPSVDFTLPLWNRNAGGIAVERATRSALKAEFDAREFQARADITAAVDGIVIARAQRDALLHDLPPIEAIAAASRRAAERGDLAPAAAEIAEQTVRDKQSLLTQSNQAIIEQTIALELLTGVAKEMWTP